MRGPFRLSFAFFLLAAPLAAELPWRAQGPEFQANTATLGDQYQADVASQPDGRSMAVWADAAQGFAGRLFDAAGQPLTPELLIDEHPTAHALPYSIRVAAGGDGTFLVLWLRGRQPQAQRFGAGGALGQAFPLFTLAENEHVSTVDLVADGKGGYLAAWSSIFYFPGESKERIFLRPLDGLGKPRGGAIQVSEEVKWTARAYPRIAVLGPDEAVVAWEDHREAFNPEVWARRVSPTGGVRGPEIHVSAGAAGEDTGGVPVAHPGGGFSVVWSRLADTPRPWVVARRFDAAGAPAGPAFALTESGHEWTAPAVATDPAGRILVLWSGVEHDSDGGVMGRFYTPSWQPQGEVFRINTFTLWNQTEPALAADGHGGFTAVWSSGELKYPQSPPRVDWEGQDGSYYGVFGQRFGNAPCEPGTAVLCLGADGRFEVRVRWKNPFTGETGAGKAVPLVADTGAFWFFQDTNLELLIKVLDARPVNGHFWVYFGALSDVEYTVEVTDTRTRKTRTYQNPAGRLASRADIEAFKDDGSAASPALAKTVAVPLLTPKAEGDCQASAEGLCLNQGRFLVEVELIDPRDGKKKRGQAVPLTGDTGAFWFFGDTNLELLVKVLDGRGHNGSFWVYYGALSDVDYTITVTDTVTRETKAYSNPRGRLASRGDVEAF